MALRQALMTESRNPARRLMKRFGWGLVEIAAAGFALVWFLTFTLQYLFSSAEEGTRLLGPAMTLLVALLPAVIVALALSGLRAIRCLRDEMRRQQLLLETMQMDWVQSVSELQSAMKLVKGTGASASAADSPDAAPDVGAPPSAARKPSPRLAASRAAPVDSTAELATATMEVADFIKALQFPDSAEDEERIRALRLALTHPDIARMIRAAQDVLTLLSQDGIYMDDLQPDQPLVGSWRRFASGERGTAITSVGAISDAELVSQTHARMQDDTVFRDAAQHFLRVFDRIVQEFAPNASDAELLALADTRTARAFMLVGRAAGIFD